MDTAAYVKSVFAHSAQGVEFAQGEEKLTSLDCEIYIALGKLYNAGYKQISDIMVWDALWDLEDGGPDKLDKETSLEIYSSFLKLSNAWLSIDLKEQAGKYGHEGEFTIESRMAVGTIVAKGFSCTFILDKKPILFEDKEALCREVFADFGFAFEDDF